MTVVFDTEPLVSFAFKEDGAKNVSGWLDRVYDNEIDGYVSTVNLAEFRYIASRKSSPEQADSHIDHLRYMGVTEYDVDSLWEIVSTVKYEYNPALGDAYAVATAFNLQDNSTEDVTLLVGDDDDYDEMLKESLYNELIQRFTN